MMATPQAHMQRQLVHGILRVASYLTAVGGVLDRYPFLQPYLEMARQGVAAAPTLAALDQAWQAAMYEWETPLLDEADLPLVRLRRAGLTAAHLRALILVGLVEMDARFSTVYGALHPFPDELHITVGLLDDLLRYNNDGSEAVLDGWRVAQQLARRGLVTIHHLERPRAARSLGVPTAVWDACNGDALLLDSSEMVLRPCALFDTFEALHGLLPDDVLDRLVRVPKLFDQGVIGGVMLRGMRGSGRLRIMEAVAQALGRDVLLIQHPEITQLGTLCWLAGPLAVLGNALPVIELELGPGETVSLPTLAGYDGPIGLLLNREGSITGQQAERCVTLRVPAPRYEARQLRWSQVLDASVNGNQAVVERLSRNYHLTLGGVEQAGQLARAYAALDGRDHVDTQDVQEACRALNQQTLDSLATRIHVHSHWHDLIVSDSTNDELHNLILRCRHRETVLNHLGSGFAGATRGVRALFSGPSGTGKTLAARLVATEVGLDLYRVELSAVVSKYIGETERNLSQLFARAEEQDVVLLLDEGDSLLTSRTDVRSSNDRYANMETNYLLQRLEHYEGIILITTNTVDRIDSAFQRRMDVFVEFNTPDAGQRQYLWSLHLPDAHSVSERFLRAAALRCTLTGGQIRNAALHATVLAVDAGEPVCDTFLAEGIHREYTKMGTISPLL